MKKNNLKINSNMLVSFKSQSEISEKNLKLVDILDLKNPLKGSLGDWKISEIKNVVKIFGKEKMISATIGDTSDLKKVIQKIKIFDELKLDFIKFGVFKKNTKQMLKFLSNINSYNFKTELVPVIFVDNSITLDTAFKNLESFKTFKFNFLLLDTFSKKSGDLIYNCSLNYLSRFLERSSKFGLSVGLAGKLKKSQVPNLLKLKPKIIGFRSAVCEKNDRNEKISEVKLEKIYNFFKSAKS